VFPRINEVPQASASLAQVHKAMLPDGTEVAVKVQRPGIQEQISDDIQAMYDVAKLVDQHTSVGEQFQFHRIVKTLRHSLARELDFLQEAHNCHVLRRELKDFPHIDAPVPIDEFCTERVLTMHFITGTKITDLDQAALDRIDRRSLARRRGAEGGCPGNRRGPGGRRPGAGTCPSAP
jgi:ubiquinone biosynthesis protein